MDTKDLLTAATSPSSFEELVGRALLESRARDITPMTGTEWLRVSSLPYLCARQHVIGVRDGNLVPGTAGADLSLIFLHGTALHWAVQNVILASAGCLYGIWKCNRCGHRHGGLNLEGRRQIRLIRNVRKVAGSPDLQQELERLMAVRLTSLRTCPLQCEQCGKEPGPSGAPAFTYKESWYGDAEIMIGGHPDGLIYLPWRKGWGILEVKSISDLGFWKVRHRPKVEHVIQANCYMRLTGTSWALILYWNKGANGLKALHAQEIEFDEALTERRWESLRQMREHLHSGEGLPKRVCANPTCNLAKDCASSEVCFATP